APAPASRRASPPGSSSSSSPAPTERAGCGHAGHHRETAVNSASLPARRRVFPETIAAGAGLAAVLTGGLVLVGWRLDLAPVTSIFPNLPRMVPNSAIALGLAGLALALSRKEPV